MFLLVQVIDKYDFLTGTDYGFEEKPIGLFDSVESAAQLLKERLNPDDLRVGRDSSYETTISVYGVSKDSGKQLYRVIPFYKLNTPFAEARRPQNKKVSNTITELESAITEFDNFLNNEKDFEEVNGCEFD